jgi:hypothetical protein
MKNVYSQLLKMRHQIVQEEVSNYKQVCRINGKNYGAISSEDIKEVV